MTQEIELPALVEVDPELVEIELKIRNSVESGDEFQYHKLLRAKTEIESRLFFRRQKQLKTELESLIDERKATFAVIDDLQAELTAQAEKVLELRSQAFDEQEKHNQINFRLHILRTKVENDREEIRDLQEKLKHETDNKTQTRFDESGNLKKAV